MKCLIKSHIYYLAKANITFTLDNTLFNSQPKLCKTAHKRRDF